METPVDRPPPKSPTRRGGLVLAAAFAAAAVLFALNSWRSLRPEAPGPDSQGAAAGETPPADEEKDDGVRRSTDRFDSAGKEIRIERYFPREPGRYPVILVLYGGSGIPPARGDMRAHCRDFARRGYVALLPRYFDQTDTEIADPRTIDRHFVAWMGTVGNAIDYARKLPEVDPDRVGLIGWSLGSSLALEVAATNPHATAVVGCVGGMAREILDKMTRMPPTLLLDGEDDRKYPAELARDLYRTLREKHVEVESKIYPGQGHGFGGEAYLDAERRTNAFFEKYLANPPHPAAGPVSPR
jgi:carboxymethylenebutenolidase